MHQTERECRQNNEQTAMHRESTAYASQVLVYAYTIVDAWHCICLLYCLMMVLMRDLLRRRSLLNVHVISLL